MIHKEAAPKEQTPIQFGTITRGETEAFERLRKILLDTSHPLHGGATRLMEFLVEWTKDN